MLRYRVNILCLLGAFLAIVSCFLSWQTYTFVDERTEVMAHLFLGQINGHSPIDFMTHSFAPVYENYPLVVLGVWMCVLSAFISILTPLGALSELLGLALFGIGISRYNVFFPGVGIVLDFGFFVAIIASLIVMSSMIKPLGIGYQGKSILLKNRLLTFGKIKDEMQPIN